MPKKAIEVEAEVVEDGLLAPRPVYVPAVIDAKAYLEYTAANVERLMEPYSGMTDEALAQMDPKEVKACRADVNRIIKEVEDQRKQIKAAYNGPLKAFEEAVALILEPAKAASDQLKAAVDANADKVRTMRREGLEATYMDFAPALAEVVPFERILQINPKWLNASYGAGKAAQELEDITGRHYDTINIVGGGSNADYLNRLTAKMTGRRVLAGPGEATAIGNLGAQMIADGVFPDLYSLRRAVYTSFGVKEYLP